MLLYFCAVVALFFAVLFGLGYLVEALYDARPSATLAWMCLVGFLISVVAMAGLFGMAVLRTVLRLFGG